MILLVSSNQCFLYWFFFFFLFLKNAHCKWKLAVEEESWGILHLLNCFTKLSGFRAACKPPNCIINLILEITIFQVGAFFPQYFPECLFPGSNPLLLRCCCRSDSMLSQPASLHWPVLIEFLHFFP